LSYICEKNGNQIWRSSELKLKAMDQETSKPDIKIINALSEKTGNVQIYSSREQLMKEDRVYGYE
jgi:predicted secreted protein